ncbi:hypothetical protein GTQ99_02450 [Kineococcus sp. T13]|uniref:hypothetical protein n=1 Tax=Kineococcus vitellinus TaxID=2696565 RepID=UPI001411D919|nr:hypothetical protein [Kineococcus vitellinus]NAZ74288.1 hypothetical protein [Kineococcus vitellinus]
MTEHDLSPRPPSPWTGSAYQTRHRWQLDSAIGLTQAVTLLRELAAKLTAAHTAGWWLVEPMRSGHLVAARASRRQRARQAPEDLSTPAAASPPTPARRLRLIHDPPLVDEAVFDIAAAPGTAVLLCTARSLEQVSGPAVPADVLAEIAPQVRPADVAAARWGVSTARVGIGLDLVAEGSALRLHAVVHGALVRTREVLPFQHAADGAASLLQAAAAYQELADEAEAMAIAGGRLSSCDDGFLHVDYDERSR